MKPSRGWREQLPAGMWEITKVHRSHEEALRQIQHRRPAREGLKPLPRRRSSAGKARLAPVQAEAEGEGEAAIDADAARRFVYGLSPEQERCYDSFVALLQQAMAVGGSSSGCEEKLTGPLPFCPEKAAAAASWLAEHARQAAVSLRQRQAESAARMNGDAAPLGEPSVVDFYRSFNDRASRLPSNSKFPR